MDQLYDPFFLDFLVSHVKPDVEDEEQLLTQAQLQADIQHKEKLTTDLNVAEEDEQRIAEIAK